MQHAEMRALIVVPSLSATRIATRWWLPERLSQRRP
jgi:hypothetical protein